jgi:hypothetical protein
LPAGSSTVSSGSGGPTLELSVIRSWRPIANVLDVRWLYISVAARAAGGTDLYAESQSQWVITRPAGEQIPEGVREVEVSDGWPGKDPFFSRRVTGETRVHKFVQLFNSLGTLQPVGINCPADIPKPVVTIDFLAGTPARLVARAKANASTNLPWPSSVPGWACFPISFNVGARTWTALIGNVIAPIERLLHVRLRAQ